MAVPPTPPSLTPTEADRAQRAEVMRRILEAIEVNQRIKLPDFDPAVGNPGGHPFALIGIEPNAYTGTVGDYRYQFEGEEDLLHLMVTRIDCETLRPEEGQRVAGFVLEGLPSALIWLRPGERSQHFYFGHDELVDKLVL